MKQKVNGVFVGILLLIVIAYGFIVLLLPFNHVNTYWWAFAFSIADYCLAAICSFCASLSGENDSKLYNYVIIRYSFIFVLVEFVINTIAMASGLIPIWGIVVANICVITVYMILAISFLFVKRRSGTFSKQLVEKTIDYRVYSSRVSDLLPLANQFDLKKDLEKLYDLIKYADPISPIQIMELEKIISDKLNHLEVLIRDGKEIEAIDCCSELIELIQKRNRDCLIYK